MKNGQLDRQRTLPNYPVTSIHEPRLAVDNPPADKRCQARAEQVYPPYSYA